MPAGSVPGRFWVRFLVTPGFRYTVLLRFTPTRARRRGAARRAAPRWCCCCTATPSVYGIDISRDARIGSGLYIGHFGGIFVKPGVVIGDNCNISQGVTLGRAESRRADGGCPVIGNNVYIAPGAKIIGRIRSATTRPSAPMRSS